jgi:hypothetical protein
MTLGIKIGNGLELECTTSAFAVYYYTQFFSDQYSELSVSCLSSSFVLQARSKIR